MNKKDIAKHYISAECKIKLAIKKMGNLNVNNFCLVLGKQKNGQQNISQKKTW